MNLEIVYTLLLKVRLMSRPMNLTLVFKILYLTVDTKLLILLHFYLRMKVKELRDSIIMLTVDL